jgi:anthranilate synthase component 1
MQTRITQLPGDTYTPVGIYLRMRDVFPHSLLLECTDYSSRENAFSYITLKPIAGIRATATHFLSRKPGTPEIKARLENLSEIPGKVDDFLASFEELKIPDPRLMPGLFGYTSYDAINAFDNVGIQSPVNETQSMPLLQYDLYRIVIAFNHFNSIITITELLPDEEKSITPDIISILANRNNTFFPFACRGTERVLTGDEDFMQQVKQGIKHCARGDVFQIVLSRKYEQDFSGDEFNVYRALRSINPSPYLFYFDFLDFKLFGSSPEAQLQVGDGRASINPIAGTVVRSGDPSTDNQLIAGLLADPKENSEHAMLVDLARNDLSRHARNVIVDSYREVHTYSHVIHLVSTVSGQLQEKDRLYRLFADTFPAGTLSGAPKHRAVQLIDGIEGKARGFYGGAIGFMGFDNSLNHAIMIRSFMSRNGTLHYQAGAGVVIGSNPEKELKEVNGKISALRKAIKKAQQTAEQNNGTSLLGEKTLQEKTL